MKKKEEKKLVLVTDSDGLQTIMPAPEQEPASRTGGDEPMNTLALIQAEVRVPKMHKTAFGSKSFAFRTCEDIYNAVKPVLAKYNCHILVNDSIQLIGDRFYVCAEACLYQAKGDEVILLGRCCGYAREVDANGMNPAQTTGACSSYARKYALNGLLLLDDIKDVDALTPTLQQSSEPAAMPNNDFAKSVLQDITLCTNEEQLRACWAAHKGLQKEPWFVEQIKKQKNSLTK